MNGDVRDAWVKEKLSKIPTGWKILDVGAGLSPYRSACSHLEYTSQDFCKYDGDGDGKALQTGIPVNGADIVSDICAIPLEDESVDAVLCTEVLEHVPDPVAGLREICRLIKSGGVLVLTAPFCSLTHFSPYHFCSGFNSYFYLHWLTRLGFADIEMTANGDFFQYVRQELDRLPQVEKKRGLPVTKWETEKVIRQLEAVYSKHNGSSELLCFGYHVWARKK